MVYINQDQREGCGWCGYICPRRIPVTVKTDHKKTTNILKPLSIVSGNSARHFMTNFVLSIEKLRINSKNLLNIF